jgi:hypothetical protein
MQISQQGRKVHIFASREVLLTSSYSCMLIGKELKKCNSEWGCDKQTPSRKKNMNILGSTKWICANVGCSSSCERALLNHPVFMVWNVAWNMVCAMHQENQNLLIPT